MTNTMTMSRLEVARKGGLAAGRLKTTEQMRHMNELGASKGGKAQGAINTETGWIQALGKIQGRIAADSGQLASVCTSETCRKGAFAQPIEAKILGAITANHLRWHIKRNKKNPKRCELCRKELHAHGIISEEANGIPDSAGPSKTESPNHDTSTA